MTWLLVATLGIIWVAFLVPSRGRKGSPASSVEEFERKMNSLAEAHKASPGRWVLMPRKGKRLLDPRERRRFRTLRRRRQVFMVLLEATMIALLIGLFPPLRRMLYGAAILGGLLFLYVLFLVKIRMDEVQRARFERDLRRRQPHRANDWNGARPAPVEAYSPAVPSRTARPTRSVSSARFTAQADGLWYRPGGKGLPDPVYVRGGGVRIVDDDVHVVVYRSDEIDTRALKTAAR